MRISTNMFYERASNQIVRQSSELAKTQQQVSSGRKIIDASDDPIGAAKIIQYQQSIAVNDQFMKNQAQADEKLRTAESRLDGIVDVMQYVRDRVVETGNGSYASEQRKDIATDLRAQFDALVGLGNSKDASGEYLFAGYKTNTQPFQGSLAGITYNGDQGNRAIKISGDREVPVSLPGNEIMNNIFSDLSAFIGHLESGAPFDLDEATQMLSGLDVAINKTVQAQSLIGSRMIEIEHAKNIAENLDLQYGQSLSTYEDIDMAEAVTRLTRQQTFLNASQASFAQIEGLSLFDYIR